MVDDDSSALPTVCSATLPFEVPEDASEEDVVAAARNLRLTFEAEQWHGEAMATARAFVAACMTSDPKERPTARALLVRARSHSRPGVP